MRYYVITFESGQQQYMRVRRDHIEIRGASGAWLPVQSITEPFTCREISESDIP
jgi:hypothetical protein